MDLVYFTTRVLDTSDTNATRTTRVLHEWDSSDTNAKRRHECYTNHTSAIRTTRVRHEWKFLILITTRLKIYFHNPIVAIQQMKDYKERNNFILRTTFWKCLVPMPKCVWKVHPITNFVMAKATSKSYILDCSCKCPCTFSHSYS